jgi:hypothetical protein
MTEKRVAKSERIALRQRISVASATASEDYLPSLTALRDRLAIELDITQSKRDIAALSARLSAVLAQIDAMPKQVPSKRNEIAVNRARRQAEAARRAPVEGRPL